MRPLEGPRSQQKTLKLTLVAKSCWEELECLIFIRFYQIFLKLAIMLKKKKKKKTPLWELKENILRRGHRPLVRNCDFC